MSCSGFHDSEELGPLHGGLHCRSDRLLVLLVGVLER